jgi:Xaa-Pro aminopeptidase
VSNFSGSNAVVLVTPNKAFLWTDGRYYIQAEKELDSQWEMKKMERGQQDLKTWVKENLAKASKIGLDCNFYSHSKFVSNHIGSYEGLLKFLTDYTIVHDEDNIIDRIWENKPIYSKKPVLIHKLEYSGDSCDQKFKRVRETLQSRLKDDKPKKVALLITRLDAIACKA